MLIYNLIVYEIIRIKFLIDIKFSCLFIIKSSELD